MEKLTNGITYQREALNLVHLERMCFQCNQILVKLNFPYFYPVMRRIVVVYFLFIALPFGVRTQQSFDDYLLEEKSANEFDATPLMPETVQMSVRRLYYNPLNPNFSTVAGRYIDGVPATRNGCFNPYAIRVSPAQLHSNYLIDKSWLARKWHKEHFLEIIDTTSEKKDVWLVINPIVNLQAGKENPSGRTVFQNTRGAEAHGRIKNVEFYTAFFENQARFAQFQQAYFDARGEQRLNALGEYVTDNAIIPMGGRTKPFKDDAYDYASSTSFVRYTHKFGNDFGKKLALELGNTPHFVGWGHRSLLLSDNSFNATSLKIEFEINAKLTYTKINAKHLNVMRRQFTTSVESPYEKKNYSAHYLAYKPSRNTTIGFFEATLYFREDSVQSQWMHPLYFNPVPLLNTAVFGWENQAAKSLLGINFAQRIRDNHLLFAQVATDQLGQNSAYALQVGWTWLNPFRLHNLTLHTEFNKASERMYAAENRRLAYTHFNLPLAHTLGNGFDELIGRVFYHYKSFYTQLHCVMYQSDQPMFDQSHLFESRDSPVNSNQQRVSYNEIELGYMFNGRTQLSVFARGVYRYSVGELEGANTTTMVFFGIRNRLFNQYTDF